MLEQPPPAPPPAERRSANASGKRSVAVGGSNFGTIITGDSLPWLRSRRERAIAVAVVLVVLLGAVLVTYQFVRPWLEPPPRMTGGSTKIAVGGFDGVDARGQPLDRARTDDLALAVHRQLEQAANAPGKPSTVVWSATQTGRVSADTVGRRANDIDADIVVYGTLRVTQDATRFQPRFYITTTQLNDAQELAGDYQLGQEIVSLDDFTRNAATYEDLKNKLVDRVSGLEDMLYGLTQYRRDDLDAAAASFKSAETNKSWTGQDGKEILYLFSGFTAGKRNDLPAAAQYFSQAAALERTRARAHLGAAEVLLSRSGVQQDCAPSAVDVPTLHQALDAFQVALADPSPPPLANIPGKARYGIGQVDICLSQSQHEDRWDDAEQQFRAVIAEYEAGNDALKSLAAESHAQLGFLAQPFAGETDPASRQASYERAAGEYRQALALSGDAHPVRRAYFSWSLGLAEEQLGQLDEAQKAYDDAASTDGVPPDTRAIYEQARDRVRHARGDGGSTA